MSGRCGHARVHSNAPTGGYMYIGCDDEVLLVLKWLGVAAGGLFPEKFLRNF